MPTRIIVPDSDDETEEIIIAEWYYPNGSPVRRGQAICRIETEDEEYDLAADLDGELRQGIPEGHAVPPGSVVGLIVGEHEHNAAAGVLPQRPRTQRRPSTAFEMASVPDFSSDGIFTEAEPKPVLGRRVLPSRGAARRAAAPAAAAAQSEPEHRPADIHQLREELVQPAAEPSRSPASVIRKLNFGRKRAQPAGEIAEAEALPAEPETAPAPVALEPEPAPELAPVINLVRPSESPAVAQPVAAPASGEMQQDDWSVVESLFEHFDDAEDIAEPEVEPETAETEPVALPEAEAPLPPPPPRPYVAEPFQAAVTTQQPEAEPGLRSAADRRSDRRQDPAPPVMAAVHLMTALIHLDDAEEMREQLAEEWAAAGVAPTLTDIAVRAIAMTTTRLGIVQPGGDAIRLISISPDGMVERTLDDVSGRSFHNLVEERQGGLDAAGEAFLTVTDLSAVGIDAATPSLGDAAFAFAMGSVREVAHLDGRRTTYHPAFVLTLAYDPYQLEGALAAQVLYRVKELIERPYALVAA